ncbi:hypothetical protein HYX16_00495 [Candidatus Woesearchaeota archaeon]|nr:hypothetical protein [Candidatus Woesearchaeota archaeon]
MRLVVDSNILFTFFWKNSAFNKLSLKQELNLFSPFYALTEINKYSQEIIKKAKISEKEFKILKDELANNIEFISIKEYSLFIKQAQNLIKDLTEYEKNELLNDLDFFALALKLNCPIWSNDKLLKKQDKISVLNTKEIISLIDN